MAKTDTTLLIERLLRSYNPTELGKQKLNKFRPHFVVSECVVEAGNTKGGIVDVVRLDETLINNGYTYQCGGYNLAHSSDSTVSSFHKEYQFPCGLKGNECPRFCEKQTCTLNRQVKEYINDILITCFEIKVTKSDFHSSNGHNFVGNANYYVMPQSLYKEVKGDIPAFVGVIALQEGNNTIQLRKVKECRYKKLSDTDKMWMTLNVLKRHSKEQQVKHESELINAQKTANEARTELFALKYELGKD